MTTTQLARPGLIPFIPARWIARAVIAASVLAIAAVSGAQVNSNSDGSDGVFAPQSNVEIDLSKAANGNWLNPGTGNGVYDGSKWAVVFKYQSVNIKAGVKVTFRNHPKNAPVVWLVAGDVTINGEVNVDGKGPIAGGAPSEGGPGGFGGGAGDVGNGSQAGRGPGGATNTGFNNTYRFGGSYASQGYDDRFGNFGTIYGNGEIIPLIGGSGGQGAGGPRVGGGGAGAIMIVSSGQLSLDGVINARGANGSDLAGGSGGGVKLISRSFVGKSSSFIDVRGGTWGGQGRVRIETQNNSWSGQASTSVSSAVPETDPTLWPRNTDPRIVIAKIAEAIVPPDPTANIAFEQDVKLDAAVGEVTVLIEAFNVPVDWKMQLRVVRRNGPDFIVNAILASGNQGASLWTAKVTFPAGAHAVLARAYKP